MHPGPPRRLQSLPQEDLMELLGEGGEEGGQGEDESAQDSRQPGGFAAAEGDDQRGPEPATAQLDHADPHCCHDRQEEERELLLCHFVNAKKSCHIGEKEESTYRPGRISL